MEPMKPMKPMEPMKPMAPMSGGPGDWWPKDLGSPSSTGSQNDTRYAYFADKHRLVVDQRGKLDTYDTGSNQINGFGQQQGGGTDMSFQTSNGSVELSSLKKIG